MAPPQSVAPVKLLVALLWGDAESRDEACRRLELLWGPIDVCGEDRPFDATDYYESEMGAGLRRRLVAFERLVSPESLADAKWACNVLEDELATGGRRRVNLDIGYLDLSKVVLASVKYAGQKIAIGRGIYADLVGRYARGRYQPFEWTFPDFRDGRYDEDLGRIRLRYREQLRSAPVPCPERTDRE
ncbi:MAG: DUF4416 family protein [Pirellulales bacterium]